MRTTLKRVAIVATLSLVAGYTQPASAAVPDGVNYQGYLTNTDGTPIDTSISITFAAYNVDVGGAPLWSQTELVFVDKGLFSVTLGNPANPFTTGIFGGPVYIGIFVAGEEMLPRRQLTSVPYAYEANNSMTLDGQSAASLDQSPHVADTNNPHNVTAAQTGAISSGDLGAHAADAAAHHARYGDGEAVSAVLSADGSGSGLDADLLDGFNADAFLQSGADWGRPGVTFNLFEGATALGDKYVNENQANSITGAMIVNGTINGTDLGLPISSSGTDTNGGLMSLTNSSAGSNGNFPMGLLGQASGGAGSFYTFGVAGLAPGLGAGAPINNLPAGNQYGVAGAVNNGIGTAGVATGGSGIGVYGDGSTYAFYGVSNGTGIYAQGDTLAGEFVGDIATDRVTYNTPRTHYYSVGDGDFHSGSGVAYRTSAGNGGSYIDTTGAHWLAAGLHLPDGATITEFRAIVEDAAAGNLSITISRRSHPGSSFSTLANVASSGTPGITTYTDSSISNSVVDNQTFAYHVRVFSSNWPGNSTLKIKGAVVVYTINEAD